MRERNTSSNWNKREHSHRSELAVASDEIFGKRQQVFGELLSKIVN